MTGAAIPDAEGWQWGVQWCDGGISKGWNGRTQQDRAQEEIFTLRQQYRGCTVSRWRLVRRPIHVTPVGTEIGPWEIAEVDPWRKPLTNYVRIPDPNTRVGYRYIPRGLHAAEMQCARAWLRLKIKLRTGDHQ